MKVDSSNLMMLVATTTMVAWSSQQHQQQYTMVQASPYTPSKPMTRNLRSPPLVDTPIPVDEDEDCVYPNDSELWNTTEPNVYGEINVGCSAGFPDRVLFTEIGGTIDDSGLRYELTGDVSTNEKYRDVDYYRFYTDTAVLMTVDIDTTIDMIHNVGVNILAPDDIPPSASPFCPNAIFTNMTLNTTQKYLLPSGYWYGLAFGALNGNVDCTPYTAEVSFESISLNDGSAVSVLPSSSSSSSFADVEQGDGSTNVMDYII